MDKTIVAEHYKILAKHYPDMNITQLGLVVAMVGVIRSSMGHEDAGSTIRDYIHTSGLSDDIITCIDFLEREVLAMKKSKIDIDYWKRGNSGGFRDE